MGSSHPPWLVRFRRAGSRIGRLSRAALAVAVLAVMALVGGGAHYAARAATDAPYGGTAAAIPGNVLAENYDTGGQGVAYNVTSVNGSANSYRSDGVDLEATTDTGGPANDLGWTAAGQWFKYTVNVATAGTYTVGLRLASPSAVTDGLHIDNSAGTNLSANVIVISPSESVATISSTLNALGTQQNPNQFGTQRYEILFQPGTYGSAADPLDFQVGYYESVEGLGQNPSQVVINGTIDSWNQCTNGVQTQCYATDNFWRSISNLTINVTGLTGCFAGEEVWAASPASPMRRVDINGNTTLMGDC